MIECKSLQHIGILVPDVEISAKWYIETSGFVKKAEFIASGSRVIFVYSENTGVLCELIQRPLNSEDAAMILKQGARVDHIAYEVENLEVEFEHAKELNMDIIEGIVTVPEFWSHGFQYFLVRASGGEKVEYCKVL